MSDLLFVLVVLAFFAVAALVVKGIERL